MRYTLTTMTPLQIGDGENHTQLDSVVSNTRFYAIDMDAFYHKLHDMEKLQDYLDFIQRNRSVNEYLSSINLPPEDVQRYALELTSQNKDDLQYLRRHDIGHFIKNAHGQVYIPGSELKGGIRTALLYYLLKEEDNYDYLQSQLEKIQGRQPRRDLIKIGGQIENRLLCGSRSGPQYDIFKYIEVSDTDVHPPSTLQIGHIMTYWSKGKHLYAEVVPPGTQFTGDINIVNQDKAIKYLGLETQADLLSPEQLCYAIYEHSSDLLIHEQNFYNRNRCHYTGKFLKEINKLQQQNTPESPLLQIGQGQGFLSTTISLLVKQRDPHLYDTIRQGTRGRSYPQVFPKTRRFLVKNGNPRHRLGWVKLMVE